MGKKSKTWKPTKKCPRCLCWIIKEDESTCHWRDGTFTHQFTSQSCSIGLEPDEDDKCEGFLRVKKEKG